MAKQEGTKKEIKQKEVKKEMTKQEEIKQEEAKQEEAKQEKTKKKRKKTQKVRELTTKDVAAMLGMTPKTLRRHLRKHWYDDGKHTNYLWKENDPILKDILKTLGKKVNK